MYSANFFVKGVEPDGDVSGVYYTFQAALWGTIEVANDLNSYIPAWNIVELYAWVDLLEFEQSKGLEALARLKYTINEAEQLMP